jgi:hypothetical protein
MKALKYILIIPVALMLSLSGCEKEEDVDYTYEISSIDWIGSGLDADQDGYITSRSVLLSILLVEPTEQNVEVRVYFKLSETKEWIFYSKNTIEGLTGGEPKPVTVQLGLNPELPHGTYDFLIEIYEVDNSRIEASQEINNAKFERLINDQNLDMIVWWSDLQDLDYDEYPRNAVLNVDVNVTNDVEKEIRIEVLYRSSLSDEDYTSFYKSDYQTIQGQASDPFAVETGIYPDTLDYGLYDFKVIVTERNVFSPVLIYDKDLSDVLKQVPFESEFQDGYHYSINAQNTIWKLVIDQNDNGYSWMRTLRLDVDIDKNEPVNILAKVFRKGPDDEDYLVMDSTDIFTINGSVIDDTVLIPLNHLQTTDSVKMYHAEWDLMVGIFEVIPGNEWELRYALDSIDGTFYMQQKFELFEEDTIQ